MQLALLCFQHSQEKVISNDNPYVVSTYSVFAAIILFSRAVRILSQKNCLTGTGDLVHSGLMYCLGRGSNLKVGLFMSTDYLIMHKRRRQFGLELAQFITSRCTLVNVWNLSKNWPRKLKEL